MAATAALVPVALVATRPVRVRLIVAEAAPLGARLEVRTRLPATVEATVAGRHDDDLVFSSTASARRHTIQLLGLYPDHLNEVIVTARTADGRVHEVRQAIRTEALPGYYPTINVVRHNPDEIAPGFTFLNLGHYDDDGNHYALPSAIDSHGHVRWFYDGDVGHALHRLSNGNLLIAEEDDLVEIDMLGEPTGRRWSVPNGFHHDAIMLPDGNLLALSSAPDSFDDGLVEIDGSSGEIVRAWDSREILDPERPRQPVNLEAIDWLHLNGVEYDHHHDAIIVSGRDQSAVVSTSRTTGKLRWILGSHKHWSEEFQPFLLDPVGGDFEWQWGQHAPMVHPRIPNRVLIYDNGNKRSYDAPLAAADNYSRVVEYEIDQRTMEIRQLWEYGREYGSQLYTPFIGDADYLPNGNRLVNFGGITRTLDGEPTELFDYEAGSVRPMKISARIVEVSEDTPAREILTITIADPDATSYRGYRVYRAVRMGL
ncbi:MAG: aryl-sulfate sulfotransferase [Spirochaetota bacterium]